MLSAVSGLDDQGSNGEGEEDRTAKLAPWRDRAGTAWLELDSGRFAAVEKQSEAAPDVFAEIVSGMYAGFASPGEIPDGRGTVDSDSAAHVPFTAEIDTEPHFEADDHNIIYDRPWTSQNPDGTPSRPPAKGTRADQLCWNCREPGHTAAECPAPRSHLMTRASRERFMFERDSVMPDYARTYLLDYVFDEDERRRRLALIDRFRPGGRISSELADALFWLDDGGDDDDQADDGIVFVSGGKSGAGAFRSATEMEDGEVDEEIQARQEEKDRLAVLKRRGQWPWLIGMLKWGYPPGWVAAKDPIEVVRRRVTHMPVSQATEMDGDESEDELEIFGGEPGESQTFGRRDSTPSPPPLPPASPPSTPPPPPPPPASDKPPAAPASPPPSPPACGQHQDSSRIANRTAYRPIKSLPARPIPQSHKHNPYLVGRHIPQRRWAHYPTDMYDSARLQVYSDARPLPLGF